MVSGAAAGLTENSQTLEVDFKTGATAGEIITGDSPLITAGSSAQFNVTIALQPDLANQLAEVA